MSAMLLASAGEQAGSTRLETTVLLALAAAALTGYIAGARRLRGRSVGFWSWRRGPWRGWAFGAGVVVVVVALLPAIDPVVDESFPLHMVQHMVLMFVAAPLLALGAPGLPFLLALPMTARRTVAAVRSGRRARRARAVLVSPAVGVVGYSAILLVWHLPDVYTAALRSDAVHIAEHVCFLVAGWLLWAPLCGRDRVLEGGRGVLYVFLSGFPMSLLGAILTLADRPLYPAQTGTGAGAVAEQQLAGVLMWIPPTFLALGVCAVLVLFWLRGMEAVSPGTTPLPSAIPPPLPVADSVVVGATRRGARR
jgi:putative membrane protein